MPCEGSEAQIHLRYLEIAALLGRPEKGGLALLSLTAGELGKGTGPMIQFTESNEGLEIFELLTHTCVRGTNQRPGKLNMLEVCIAQNQFWCLHHTRLAKC